ncbi:hypothetical transmembrane protein [Photorhabdus asymbiotica]|uniref:Hypothetical transmembrane protein n=1 Tax=Photorhabdus asymbiotica subsp. asymbiotica (strain ATCC 43949 / 3105-77) TaxID=553480 RepID=B6VMB8_PHOAA|nr:hypothetical transmembrane protein [Photorhabdus asymbiotica]CAR67298.1 hypothetical transmembrane protein [Photorhabdus asymbiotica subsp. asymbiotica ATCC 43949]
MLHKRGNAKTLTQLNKYKLLIYIPFILQVAALLAAFTHPSHRVIYAPGDSFTCRRAATRNLLGINDHIMNMYFGNF